MRSKARKKFEEAERRFAELDEQYHAGTLSDEEFNAKRRELMVEEPQGRWWAQSRRTGEWYYNDGDSWVRGTRPVYEHGRFEKLLGRWSLGDGSKITVAAVLGGVAIVVLAALYFLLWPALFGGKQPISEDVSLDELAYERIGDFTLKEVMDKGGNNRPEDGGDNPSPGEVDDATMRYTYGDGGIDEEFFVFVHKFASAEAASQDLEERVKNIPENEVEDIPLEKNGERFGTAHVIREKPNGTIIFVWWTNNSLRVDVGPAIEREKGRYLKEFFEQAPY